jgi:hypothetical protein
MTDIDNITASQRILAHLHEGRLVQGTFHIERDGRELACLLGAIAPGINDTSKCPASVMPSWLAQLTIPMFDWQSKADALSWAARFGAQMGRWHVLDSAAWERVRAAFCSACVADARRSADRAAANANAAANATAWAIVAVATAYDAAADSAHDAAADSAHDAAESASNAAAWAVPVGGEFAARQACWTRFATTLCDLIDAELAALAAKGT